MSDILKIALTITAMKGFATILAVVAMPLPSGGNINTNQKALH